MSRFQRSALVSTILCIAITTHCFALGCLAQEFQPIDTSKLMGSPNPIPLQAELAFPELKFKRPIELTFPSSDQNQLYVVEQQGVIRRFENSSDVTESKVFLDITDRVSREGNEEGLLGFAFHPDYEKTRAFFVYYSKKNPRASVIAKFQAPDDQWGPVEPSTETVLLEIPQPFGNHNGGSIKFGPDGMLYIGLGDGGLAHDPYGNGQDLSTLLGSILRIDVDANDAPLNYSIPEDNPFVDRKQARGEIYAYGFRNNWRISFDRETGDLWTADVGQERYEEVNRVEKGGNYGWKIREGRHPFDAKAPQGKDPLIDPVAEYFHSEGQSITGGVVYRGEKLKEYHGRYFFADYVTGNVWTLAADGDKWKKDKVAETGLKIAAFGEDQSGEMYLCTFDGQLYSLAPREIDIEAQAAAFPKKLSETGLFESLEDHQLKSGILPYDVNVPFWSDGAIKQRFVAFPDRNSITFDKTGNWKFAKGTVFIKTFLLPKDKSKPISEVQDFHRLETRLFVHGNDGWAGYTYIWNDDLSDAELIDDSRRREYEVKTDDGEQQQTWHFPSRVECMACHSKASGFVLGWNTRQLNRQIDYESGKTANQIDVCRDLKLFESDKVPASKDLEAYPAWRSVLTKNDRPKGDADLEQFVRAWLDVNCTMCHHPDGIAGKVSGNPIDLRYHTPLEKTGIVGRKPSQGQLSPQGSAVIAPGHPDNSELIHRLSSREERKMPPIATLKEDQEAIRVVKEWIIQLSSE